MGKISAPGIYDIDIDRYHHDPHLCDAPSISSSGLRTLLLECPAKYWAFSPYNPNHFPDESTKALDIGRAAHCLVLGEPEFAKHFYVSPHDVFNKNPGKQWYDGWKIEVEAGREKRTLLKPDQFETVQAVAAVRRRSAQAMRAFENGLPEQSLIHKDEETGVYLKSRPDWLPHKPANSFLVEYKSALSIDPRRFSYDAFKYGYHMQGAMQLDAVEAVMGVKPFGLAHCVQEKDPPYLCELRLFQPDHFDWGRKQYRRALRLFARCMERGEWPSYTSEATFIETPYSVAKDMEIGWTDDFERNYDNGSEASGKAERNYTAADYVGAG